MNSIIKMYVKICWLAVCLVGFAFQSSATHVVGGDLTYECLGNDQYSISLTFQRDCLNGDAAAPFDEPAVVKIFDAVTNNLLQTIEMPLIEVMNLDEIVTNNCKVLGDPVCVDQAYYQSTVTLPFRANGYIVSYRRCCRNFTLLNVVDPLDTGSTYWAMISPTAQTQCNSQAVFNNWPTIYLCADEELVFDHSATDADGDSLVYKICNPSAGGSMQFPLATAQYFPPFEETAFAAPFTLANMMGGVPLTIDSETGLMTATPDQVGQYLIGICVEEYRNGVKISETRRDFEYNVRECSKGPESIFVAAPSPNCTDLSIMLENSSIVNINAPLTFEWIFDYPNGGVESTEETPNYTYAVGGLYTIALAVSDGECVDTSFQTIGVSLDSDPMVGFTVSNTDCADILVVTLEDNSTSTQDIVGYSWSVTKPDGSIETSTDATISFSMMNTGDVSVSYTVTTISGCSNTIEETVNIVNNSFTLDIANISGCEGEMLPIGDLAGYDVTFTPDGIVSLDGNGMYVALVGAEDVVVAYAASNAVCEYSSEFTISSGVLDLAFETEVTLCPGGIAFLGVVPEGYTVTGDGVYIDNGGLYVAGVGSGTYGYTLASSTGCTGDYAVTVSVEDDLPFTIAASVSLCGDGVAVIAEGVTSGDYTIATTPDGFTSIVDGSLVVSGAGTSVTLMHLITSSAGCTYTATTEITVNDNPDLNLVDGLGLCVLESTTVTVEGSENSTYSWSSTGDLAILSGSDEATVTIIMSGDMGGDLFVTCTSPDGCTAVGQTAVAAYDTPNETIVSPLYACEGEELVLPTYGDYTTIYTVLTGSGSVDGGVYTYPIVSTGSGITTLSTTTLDVTISSEFCSQSGIVNIMVTPDPVNPAATPLMQCEGESVTLNAGALEGYDYVWSSVPFYPFTNPFEASPSVSVDQNTVFHVIATSTNGSGCSFEADIEVMYNALVEATFVPAIDTLNLCPDQMVNLVVETSAPAEVWCYYNYFTITGSGTSELVSVFTGSGTTTNNLYDFDFMVMSGSGSGYIEKVIISDAGCTSSLILPVNIYNADVVINDIGNGTGIGTITYCAGDSVELLASSDQTVVTAMWFDMNGNPVSTTNPYVFVPTMGGVYTVEATLANGCIATSMVTLIESDPMVGITSSTGGEFCEGETITLTADVTPDNLVVTWVCTDGTTGTGSEITIVPQGVVSCTATVMDGDCEDSETITLTPQIASVVITPATSVICPGECVDLTAITGDDCQSTIWSTGEGTPGIQVCPTQTTEYTVTCVTSDGCEATATAIVTVESAPSVTATASPESIEAGGSSTLSVSNPDAACTYTWFDAAGNEIGTGTSISVTPGSTMTYSVTCVTEAGCSSSANVTVTVTATPDEECRDEMVYIPNTFSPNGDNSNDRYILYSEDDVIQIEFLIYDRWGEQVYKGNNITDFWDGTYEGELLNPDVYGYCVRWTCPYDGSVEYLKTGNITLIR